MVDEKYNSDSLALKQPVASICVVKLGLKDRLLG